MHYQIKKFFILLFFYFIFIFNIFSILDATIQPKILKSVNNKLNTKIFHVEKFVGEQLQYKIYWGFIYAADAGLNVNKINKKMVKFCLWAKTAPVVKWIYPARDVVCSTVIIPGPKPIHYHKDSKEGWRSRKIIDVIFKNNKCFYYKNKKLKNILEIKNPVQDPLSAFFVFRCLDFSHSPVHIMMTDGKHIVQGEIYVLGKQTITTPAGKFKTILIEPKLYGLKGIFEKSPNAKILVWLTDDKWRIPVKMSSKVIVGHFCAELVSYKLKETEEKDIKEEMK